MTVSALTRNNIIGIANLSDSLEIAESFGLKAKSVDEQATAEALISDFVTELSPHVSGVCLSAEVGFGATEKLPLDSSLVFELSDMLRPKDPLSVPVLSQIWGVEQTRNNNAVAKLELFYNPQEEEARSKKQMVIELYDYCQHENIPFLLDLVLYLETSRDKYQAQFLELQLDAVQELRQYCDLMALEYPSDALSAVTLTAELDVPWIISGRGVPYETYKEQLRVALESGAVGYIVGSQFLPEKVTKDASTFLQTTVRDRAIELERIATETLARSMTEV